MRWMRKEHRGKERVRFFLFACAPNAMHIALNPVVSLRHVVVDHHPCGSSE